MEYSDKEYCLEVWGDMACFTRPELKVERVSYDVITPSAARAIFEAIFWKPAIHWQITKIEVLNPIKWTSIRRNEVGAVAGRSPIFIEEQRQMKNTLCLRMCVIVFGQEWSFVQLENALRRATCSLMNQERMRTR